NDDMQGAARLLAEALLAVVEAQGRAVWGEPDYRVNVEDGEEVPAWVEDLPRYPVRLVGWRRGRGKVAFVYWEQEDRELPVAVDLGVVRWRAGTVRWR